MVTKLINFWRKSTLDGPLFAHPEDLPVLHQKGSSFIQNIPTSFDKFIEDPGFDEPRLHLRLLPQPYSGNLRTAEIVVLLLNPGLTHSDYWGETRMATFRKRLKGNLWQSFEGVQFPFMWLDPEFCWHGGFIWWERKLREVINTIAREKFDGRYLDAMRDLSSKLVCLELVPYHSFSFGAHKLIYELPSVKIMREFVSEQLVPEAKNGELTMIATRQQKAWGLPDGEKHIVIYKGGHTRGASLSPNSEGGKAILRRYGIRSGD